MFRDRATRLPGRARKVRKSPPSSECAGFPVGPSSDPADAVAASCPAESRTATSRECGHSGQSLCLLYPGVLQSLGTRSGGPSLPFPIGLFRIMRATHVRTVRNHLDCAGQLSVKAVSKVIPASTPSRRGSPLVPPRSCRSSTRSPWAAPYTARTAGCRSRSLFRHSAMTSGRARRGPCRIPGSLQLPATDCHLDKRSLSNGHVCRKSTTGLRREA